jgi:bifunctional non-homologous end joining protein LigD
VSDDRLRVQNRNDKPLADSHPELGELCGLVDHAMVLDGEVVTLDESPRLRIAAAAEHRHSPAADLLKSTPVVYYVFDVLDFDGSDMTKRPYDERREVLGGLGLDGRSVKVRPRFVDVEGAVILSTAQQHGIEGCGGCRTARGTGGSTRPGPLRRGWNLHVLAGRQETWEDSPDGWPQPWGDAKNPEVWRTNGRPIA